MILRKRLPFTPFTILYAQKMPVWDHCDDDTLGALVNAAIGIGNRENAIFLRINPNIPEALIEGQKDKFVALGFRHLPQRWSFWNSPRDVARVDLTAYDSPQQYFNQLEQKTRTDTRKARRRGVTIEVATTKAELEQFYEVFREFSLARNFMVRPYAYQERLWDTYLRQGMGRLLVAKYQGKIVGGYVSLAFAGKCLGMHTGTRDECRNLGIDDAFTLEVINWAKENGCAWFSFRGVGTTPSQEAFKRKFKPDTVALVGYYDLPFKPLLYKVFYWTEFTLLPAAWPLIIRIRKLADLVIKSLSRATQPASTK